MNPPNTGFNFGQPASSSGLTLTSQAGNTPSSGFSFNTGNVGASAAASTPGGFNFGSTAAKPSGSISFGQAAGTTSSVSFNLGQQQPSNTAPSSQPAASSSSGFSFGLTTQPSTGGLSLGASTPAATTNLGLAVTSQTPASTSLNFSLTKPSSVSVPAATTSTVGSFNFAKPNATSGTTTGLTLGGALASSTATSTNATNFGFGLTNAAVSTSAGGLTSSAAGGGFKFATTTTSAGTSTLFNLSSSTANQTGMASTGLGGPAPTTTGAGLGGTVTSTAATGETGSLAKLEGKSAKESQLPQEIFSTIADFMKYKESEKTASKENARQSATSFHKLGDDAKKMKQHILKLSNEHAKLHIQAARLKSSVEQQAGSVEMARRTHETPAGMQGTNKAPEEFFIRLFRSFEDRMANSRKKIEEVERCFNAYNNSNTTLLPETDVMEILRKEHETVKMLAARIYEVHTQLLNIHKNAGKKGAPIPEPFFKPTTQEPFQRFHQPESSVARPCIGEVDSGLQNFQNGQMKAKAMSLSATPPVVALTQASILGSSQNSMLGSTLAFGSSNNNTFNTSNTSFNLGNKPSFGTNFGQNTLGQTNSLGFGSSFNTSGFGVKPLGK